MTDHKRPSLAAQGSEHLGTSGRPSSAEWLALPTTPRPELTIDTGRATGPEPRFLACPYYKRSPNGRPKQRSCVYPGFPSIARLKYHNHSRCCGCYRFFAKQEHLRAHQAQHPSCQTENYRHDFGDGFNEEQKELLKKKERTSKTKTDGDIWKGIYEMLFPGEQAIPSPFSSSTELDIFRDYLHKNMDRAFDDQVGDALQGIPIQLDVHQAKRLFHDIHDQLIGQFQAHLHDDDRSSCTSRASTPLSSASPSTPLSFQDPPIPTRTNDYTESHASKRARTGHTGSAMHIFCDVEHQAAAPTSNTPQITVSQAWDTRGQNTSDGNQAMDAEMANDATLSSGYDSFLTPSQPVLAMPSSPGWDWLSQLYPSPNGFNG